MIPAPETIINEENKPLFAIIAIALLATIAKAFKKRTLDIKEFIGELITSGLLAFGIWHLGIFQGLSIHAIYVGAVCWFTGVSLTRHAQWGIRLLAVIAKGKADER